MKLGILNEFYGNEKKYIDACEELGISYELVDIISDNWIDNIKNIKCDGYLVRPSYAKDVWKKMYDERLYFINKIIDIPIYPSYDALFLYENKMNMAYWLDINGIPHAKTWIFYRVDEAIKFIEECKEYPLIFKPNVGSAALGIKFINNKKQAIKLIKKIFTRFKFYNRGYTKWNKSKYGISYPIMDDKQFNFVMFQKVINIKTEWRMIRLGDSYFGHQKLKDGKFHSGSGLVGWVNPSVELLDMTEKICNKGKFRSMDVDIFEDYDGNFYVNELQSIFGSYDNSQMYIDGKPGRYKKINKEWVFEEGYFNQNGSCNLRVLDFIEQLKVKKVEQ